MVKPPKISVVVPTFDRERTVERSIRSALAQEPAPFEVIVVDDGSSDGTPAVVEALSAADPRVKSLRLPENLGVPTARNRGIAAAQGEWVALLDSDDVFLPGHLARMGAAIEATEGRALFYFADVRRPDEYGRRRQWELAVFEVAGAHELTLDATDWVLRPRIPMMLQASVFDRARLLAAGGLWEALRMRDDTHLFLRLGVGGAACAVAGLGTEMTTDGGAGRLTVQLGTRTRRYHELSVLMWEDLIARHTARLAGPHRTLLQDRLARAHLRLARMDLASGALRPALARLTAGLRARPASLWDCFAEAVARKLAPERRADGGARRDREEAGAL